MDLAQIFVPSRCIADQRFADKTACLTDLVRRAAAVLEIAPQPIIEAILHREALGSTGLGSGIALPHARLAEIESAFAMITRLREPIPFEAIDDKPVDIICLVLLPAAKTAEQLNVLARVARRLREKPRLEAIRKAKDGKSLHAVMTSA